jgi:hypothetical protein
MPAELIPAGGETLWSERSMSSLILFGIRKNCLISGRSWKESIFVSVHKKGDKTG